MKGEVTKNNKVVGEYEGNTPALLSLIRVNKKMYKVQSIFLKEEIVNKKPIQKTILEVI